MLKFLKTGIQNCGIIYTKKECKTLLKEIYKTRNFKKIFLSKSEYLKGDRSFFKKNPSPGRNLLHKTNCSFIFENNRFKDEMSKTLGKNYRVLDYKLVMGVPVSFLPNWVKTKTSGNLTCNLGVFIKPKYRDITYFKGIEFHQDIIDYPTRSPDFVTVYIYLENVDKDTSPLYLVPNSHKLGATIFPHDIIINKKNKKILYKNKKNKNSSKILMLFGKAGSMSYWHPFILHGTQPHKDSIPRISVRLLVEKNRRCMVNCNLDKINRNIHGKTYLNQTQKEFNKRVMLLKEEIK